MNTTNTSLTFQAMLITGLVLISSCSSPVSPPVLPEWDAKLHVPVMLQTYTVEDIIGVDSSIRTTTGEQNTLVLTKEIPINRIALGDNLRLENKVVSFVHEIGALNYDIPNAINQSIPLNSLFPSLNAGQYVIPAITNERAIDVPIDAGTHFREMTFDDGLVTFRLENTLSVPLTFPAAARILDEQRRPLLQIPVNDVIQPGKSINLQPISLSGMTLFSKLIFSFVTATPGSDGKQVAISQDMGLRIVGSITQSKIRSAVAFLPTQHRTFSEVISIVEANSKLLSGTVRTGKLHLQIVSKLPIASEIDITLDGAEINGVPVHRKMSVTARGSTTLSVPLDGVLLSPVNQTGLESSIDIQTIDAGSLISISSRDRIEITASLEDVAMEQMTGTIQPLDIFIDQSQNIDFQISSKLKGNISYKDVNMQVQLQNHSALPVHLNRLDIIGSDGPSSSTLHIPQSNIPSRSMQTVTLDPAQATQFFNAFPGGFPSTIRANGLITLNREGAYGTAHASDSLSGALTVEIPMKVSFQNTELNDVAEMNIDANTQKKATSVNEGLLTFDLENHLPAGITIEPEILDNSSKLLLSTKDVTGQVIHISAGSLDAGGRVKDAARQKVQMRFAGDDFRKLLAGKYIRATVRIATQDNAPVVFRTTDYIKIRAFATINVHSDIVSK